MTLLLGSEICKLSTFLGRQLTAVKHIDNEDVIRDVKGQVMKAELEFLQIFHLKYLSVRFFRYICRTIKNKNEKSKYYSFNYYCNYDYHIC